MPVLGIYAKEIISDVYKELNAKMLTTESLITEKNSWINGVSRYGESVRKCIHRLLRRRSDLRTGTPLEPQSVFALFSVSPYRPKSKTAKVYSKL